MYFLDIKPLSLNCAYRGRRFTTPELKSFKQAVYLLAPKITIPKGKLKVKFIFGVSSKNADGDNLIKIIQDCLAEIYHFNDKMIYKWDIEKIDVKKGEEFIEFQIEAL